MRLRFKFWVEEGKETLFGEGTRRILENIGQYGSISQAARKMHMSYRQAWGHIKRVENRLGKRLVETEKGGVGGGGARLTAEGTELVRRLERLKEEGEKALQEVFDSVFPGERE